GPRPTCWRSWEGRSTPCATRRGPPAGEGAPGRLPGGPGAEGHRGGQPGGPRRDARGRPDTVRRGRQAMNTKGPARLHDRLTPLERLPLIVAAVERGGRR